MNKTVGKTQVELRYVFWISAVGRNWKRLQSGEMNIGPNPTLVASESSISFGTYETPSEACLDEHFFEKDGFKRAYHSLKSHKAPKIDKLHVNVIIPV